MAEFALHGYDLFGEVVKPKAIGPVAERFTMPPFTVLDARTGEWQERKRAWAALGDMLLPANVLVQGREPVGEASAGTAGCAATEQGEK